MQTKAKQLHEETAGGRSWSGQTYDPTYDPLVSDGPGLGADYAPTYWIDTAGAVPEDDGPIRQDIEVDVAVIGSGYTGLSTAIHLAKDHGIQSVVLEANRVAWGCSTRNGGQAQISSGRLKRSEWISRWGIDVAKKMHAEVAEAFELFRDLACSAEIGCDPQDGGHYYIAHKKGVLPKLQAEADLLNNTFGYEAKMLSREELHENVVREAEAEGAMYEPDGVCIHAAKLAFGYLRLARKLGAKVHTSSPVIGQYKKGGYHYLTTPGGTVRAKSVAIATAGYTSKGLGFRTKDRLMPILSNSIVTRVLTQQQIEACGFKTSSPLTDTRTLRHYYRFLPDNRLQIGSRSAITGRDAANPKHLNVLINGMERKFPALKDVELDYSWWGWVDVSHDMMPRITKADPEQQVFYAMGYGGNGVMYSAQAGRRMAQMVAGVPPKVDLPIFASELPNYGPLSPFRRLGQWMAYRWYYLNDELL